jgi:hypothetical protein
MDVKGVRFSDEIMAKLAEPFPDTDVILDRPSVDGFQPSYIPWDKITGRLDLVFGGSWSYQIIKYELNQNLLIVHGRISVEGVAADVNGKVCVHTITKDGIGTCQVTMVGGQVRDLGADLKTASTDALKRAAILFRIGIQLYQRDGQKTALAQQAATVQQDQQHLPAQPHQIQSVKILLQRYQYPEQHACQALSVQSLDQITALTAAQLLGGMHPLVIWLDAQLKARTPAAPIAVPQAQQHSVSASNA